MINLFGIILILFALPFIIGGYSVYKKKIPPQKIDTRIAGIPRPWWPHAHLPFGFMFFFMGLFIILYPLNVWVAWIISGSGILVELILYFKHFFKATKP